MVQREKLRSGRMEDKKVVGGNAALAEGGQKGQTEQRGTRAGRLKKVSIERTPEKSKTLSGGQLQE